jgi:glycosyltransferase involved in cell wall biosynthesis
LRAAILATAMGPLSRGAGQYARNLLPRLLPLLAANGCSATVVLPAAGAGEPLGATRTIRPSLAIGRRTSRILAEQLYAPLAAWRADVLLSLDSRLPFAPLWARRTVVVLHDIQILRHLAAPECHPMENPGPALLYMSLGMRAALRRADTVIVVSRFMASELVSFCGVPASKVVCIANGVDRQRFRPVGDPGCLADLKERYSLPDRFYLFVGQPSLQKNLRLVVDLYASMPSRLEELLPVVVAWDMRRRELFSSTLDQVERERLGDLFRFVGYVSDADMPVMYSAANALLYPSLYEGFGLPPLEAMACGTPVIGSDRAAIPEVVGDAALLIDPTSRRALLEALRQVNDPTARAWLVRRGLERARYFSWDKTAHKVADVVCQ